MIKKSELDCLTLLMKNLETSKLYMLHHSVIDIILNDFKKIV